jgi:hypothetical protein
MRRLDRRNGTKMRGLMTFRLVKALGLAAALLLPALALFAWVLVSPGATLSGGFGYGLLFGLAFYLPLLPWVSGLVGAGPWLALSLLQALALNPAVLLLDEATSRMDADTQDCIKRALDKLLHQRTALVVAHRLRTIEQLNEIVVLEHGRIVQQGTHRQLLKTPGLYRTLIAAL